MSKVYGLTATFKVAVYAERDDEEIDSRMNRLFDRLGEIDTTDLGLAWDFANWERDE